MACGIVVSQPGFKPVPLKWKPRVSPLDCLRIPLYRVLLIRFFCLFPVWTFAFPFIPSLIFFAFCPYLVMYTGPKVRGLLPGCSAPLEEEGKKNYYFHNFQDLLFKNLKYSRTLKTHEGPQINKPKRKKFIPMIGWVFVENALFSSFWWHKWICFFNFDQEGSFHSIKFRKYLYFTRDSMMNLAQLLTQYDLLL